MKNIFTLIFALTLISFGGSDESPDEIEICDAGFYISGGPFIDEDLCSGNFGKISLSICCEYTESISFYYNSILIPSSDVALINDQTWSVAIVNAVESAELKIVNEESLFLTYLLKKSELGC
jgi:hypothetical protein